MKKKHGIFLFPHCKTLSSSMCIIHVNVLWTTIIIDVLKCLNKCHRFIFHINLNLFPKQIGIDRKTDKPQSDKKKPKNTKAEIISAHGAYIHIHTFGLHTCRSICSRINNINNDDDNLLSISMSRAQHTQQKFRIWNWNYRNRAAQPINAKQQLDGQMKHDGDDEMNVLKPTIERKREKKRSARTINTEMINYEK